MDQAAIMAAFFKFNYTYFDIMNTEPSPRSRAKSLFARFCIMEEKPGLPPVVNYEKSKENATGEVRRYLAKLEKTEENAEIFRYWEDVVSEISKMGQYRVL